MTHHEPDETNNYFPLVDWDTHGEISNTPRDDKPRPERKSIWERMNPISFIILFVGSALLFIVLLVLAFFWKTSIKAKTTEEPNRHWVRIINASWGARFVTICTLIIRAVVAFQASLATSMVAGILIETIGVPLFEVPFYSIIRAVQVSPVNLLTSANLRPHDLLSFFMYCLVILEVLVTAASQFLSTIFLSDFADSTFTQTNSTHINVLNEAMSRPSPLWQMPPATSWTLAEYSEPFIEGPNFHDTGHTYRAFIPFGEEPLRRRLRKFHGPVTVVDQRVFCTSPNLVNLTLISESREDIRLSGRIALDSTSYSVLQDVGSPSYIGFSCLLQKPSYLTETPGGHTTMCFVNQGDWSALLKDPFVEPTSPNPHPGSNYTSKTFMILDVLSMVAIQNGVGANHVVQTTRKDGPWAMVTNGSDVEALRISACVTNLASKAVIADMHSFSDNLEPEISWDHQNGSYNTENVRRQLGASVAPESSKDRGVLVLEPKSQWQTFETNQGSNEDTRATFFSTYLTVSLPWHQLTSSFSRNNTPSQGVIFSKFEFGGGLSAHLIHASVFQDTLKDTESPALALQVMLARICQMAYYEDLVKQKTREIASTTLSLSASMPMQWVGFTIGTAIIVSHLIIVAIFAAMFIRYTKYSCIGNYWQAVSQVISKDTRPIMEQADKMKDDEIKVWAQNQLLDVKSSTFLRYRQDGRIALNKEQYQEL
ncbi:hypothetical protein ACMFMG_001129 [Clarireedia jacksonii]